jgi:hypothetical protein
MTTVNSISEQSTKRNTQMHNISNASNASNASNVFTVFIDSRCRDMTQYITPSKYTIHFLTEFSNVVSVELVHAIYGKGNNTDKYTNLHIDEIESSVISHVKACHGAFTQLPFCNSHNVNELFEYTQSQFSCIHVLQQPLLNLSKLSFAFTDRDGSVFPIADHILRFNITCLKQIDTSNENNTVNNLQEHHIRIDPYTLLGVSHINLNLDTLVDCFKMKAKELRRDGYTKDAYEQLKSAFSFLAQTLKK